MKLDLNKAAASVRAMLSDAVAEYVKLNADPRKKQKHPPVSRIDLNYWLYDGGPSPPFVMLHIDTRPQAEPDGTWSHEAFAELKLPKWREAIETMIEGESVQFSFPDGSRKDVAVEDIESTFGKFFVDALKSARAEGVFKVLPKTSRCELGVEENEGSFGWPEYSKRGKENLAEETKPAKK